MSYQTLKERQRAERVNYPENLSLRVHRALSWFGRAEQCNDEDGRFIFLWISFNAAYANETGELRIPEGRRVSDFLSRLVELDSKNDLASIVWDNYSNKIRLLLENRYVFQPYWDFKNRLLGYEDWEDKFDAAKKASHKALASHDTSTVLNIVFTRLYTLRNQMIHGGSTYGSSINRKQLIDCVQLMGQLVPAIIGIMMDNFNLHWGEGCYPVIDSNDS